LDLGGESLNSIASRGSLEKLCSGERDTHRKLSASFLATALLGVIIRVRSS